MSFTVASAHLYQSILNLFQKFSVDFHFANAVPSVLLQFCIQRCGLKSRTQRQSRWKQSIVDYVRSSTTSNQSSNKAGEGQASMNRHSRKQTEAGELKLGGTLKNLPNDWGSSPYRADNEAIGKGRVGEWGVQVTENSRNLLRAMTEQMGNSRRH